MTTETQEHEYTIGEFEEMDLSELHDKTFMVAMSTGPRDKAHFLCTTLCGPFNFFEMTETVAHIYQEYQCHAKAMICSDEFGKPPEILDENTIDFLEARAGDIIMNGMLGGDLMESKKYTCKAGFITLEEETE